MLVISKPGTKYVTNHSIATLITIENRPKVTTLIGKNKSLIMGLIIFWTKTITILANINVIQLEKRIVGRKYERIQRVMAVFKNSLINSSFYIIFYYFFNISLICLLPHCFLAKRCASSLSCWMILRVG